MSRRKVAISLLFAICFVTATAWLLWRGGILGVPSLFVKHFDGMLQEVPGVANGPWGDRPVDKIPVLVGQKLEMVQEQLGIPNQEFEFSMGSGLDEFRCELLNTYPPGSPRSLGVRIKEWQWRYRGFTVAVWFHRLDGQWIALDSCRWKDGVVF
jgi:hypothetical protein